MKSPRLVRMIADLEQTVKELRAELAQNADMPNAPPAEIVHSRKVSEEMALAHATFGEPGGPDPAIGFLLFLRQWDDSLRMRIVEQGDGLGPSATIEFQVQGPELRNLGEFLVKVSFMNIQEVKEYLRKKQEGARNRRERTITLSDAVRVQDVVSVELKPSTGKWKLEGLDTFEGDSYPLPGEYDGRREAEAAAEVRLKFLEDTQPSKDSGGQGGIQDQVFIVAPDGGKHRYFSKERKRE